jgi:hypothetical protein
MLTQEISMKKTNPKNRLKEPVKGAKKPVKLH